MLLSKIDRIEDGRIFIIDEHKRAPKGGISLKGKEFKGGQFIPSEYHAEFEKETKKKKQEGSNKQEKKQKEQGSKGDKLTKEEVLKKLANNESLKGANLSGVNLSGANLKEANLSGTNLLGANLLDADLLGANLKGADLLGANLSGADLSEANLAGANLKGADLSDVYLSGADLRGVYLSNANLKGANLKGADLLGANLSGADLSEANLAGANLKGADLLNADLRVAYLSGANLSGADLSGADLSEANLISADLSGANLSGANLYNVNLYNVNLSDANLSGADLRVAYLSGANLSGADLSGADLSEVNLTKADLSDANLKGTKFSKKSFDLYLDYIIKGHIGHIDNILIDGKKIPKKIFSTFKQSHILLKDILRSDGGVNKEESQNKLHEVTGIPKDIIYGHIKQWAKTSADHHPVSMMIQLLSKSIFNLENSKIGHLDEISRKQAVNRISNDEETKETIIKLLKAQYDETQKLLKKKGIKNLHVYRGVGDSYKGEKKVGLQPLSSFSLERVVAKNFGKNIIQMIVPAEKVFSCPLTGFGCTKETEVVVLGGEYETFDF
jgi:uncharacterized protein YjbI with pentapeptide repeats